MKIPFKITDSGLKLGSQYITLDARTNPIGLIDRGFDFMIQTDMTLKVGHLNFGQVVPNARRLRFALNIPCMKTFNTAGDLLTPGAWSWAQGGGATPGLTLSNLGILANVTNYSNEHIYIWKEEGNETTYYFKSSRGLSGVPQQVSSSWKLSRHLVRLTINWPSFYNNKRIAPWSSGYSTSTSTGNIGGKYLQTFGYHSWGVKVILPANRDWNWPVSHIAGVSTFVVGGRTVPKSGAFLPEVTMDNGSGQFCYYVCDQAENSATTRKDTYSSIQETEGCFFFEGGSRDIALTPILTNEDGSLQLVTMDNNLNSSGRNANVVLSDMTNNTSDNPDFPSIQDLDSRYIKI